MAAVDDGTLHAEVGGRGGGVLDVVGSRCEKNLVRLDCCRSRGGRVVVWEGTAAASAASTLPSQEPPLRLWSTAAAATAAAFRAAGDGGGEACTGAAPALGAASAAACPGRRGTAGRGAADVDATDVDAMAAAAAAAAASSAAANDAFAAANAVAEAAVEAAICAHIETRQHGPTNLPTRVAALKAGDKQLPWNALRHSRPPQNSKSCCRSLREHLVQ